MRFSGAEKRERICRPDITSLVDVVFLLIVFFLTTSSLVELTRAEVNLPQERGEEEVVDESSALVININENGRYIVENRTVGFMTLMAMVDTEIADAGGPGALDVLIRADRAASLSALNRLAEGLISLEVASWRLATEAPAGGAGAVSGGDRS